MKNQWIKITGTIALAMVMIAGINAQSKYGKGNGPQGNGNGQGYHQSQGYHQGQGYRQGQGYHQGQGKARAFASLDLTEEQQEQMAALRLEHYKGMKPLKNQMNELKARKQTLMSEEEADLKAIHKVIDQQTDLSNKIQKLSAEHRLAARAVLTDKQVMKFDQRKKIRKI